MAGSEQLSPRRSHLAVVRSRYRRSPLVYLCSSVRALVQDPPRRAEEGFSRDGATTTTAVALPEVSSIQAIDIPFVQQPGRFVREVQ